MKNAHTQYIALRIVFSSAFLVVLSPYAFAQSNPWSVTFLGGLKFDGGTKDLEQAMRAADFDDTSPAFFGNALAHPFSSGGGSALSVDVTYKVREGSEPWAVGLVYTRGSEGQTLGFHGNVIGQFLFVSHSVSTIAPKISRVFGIAYVGAGPAFHRVKISEITPAGPASNRHSKLGFVAEAGVKVPIPPRLPSDMRILFDVKLQYRHVGRATAGPYTPVSPLGSPATFPATNVSFNDWFFGIGPGLSF